MFTLTHYYRYGKAVLSFPTSEELKKYYEELCRAYSLKEVVLSYEGENDDVLTDVDFITDPRLIKDKSASTPIIPERIDQPRIKIPPRPEFVEPPKPVIPRIKIPPKPVIPEPPRQKPVIPIISKIPKIPPKPVIPTISKISDYKPVIPDYKSVISQKPVIPKISKISDYKPVIPEPPKPVIPTFSKMAKVPPKPTFPELPRQKPIIPQKPVIPEQQAPKPIITDSFESYEF